MTKLICGVETCLHNCDHYCCKNAISVEGEQAETAASTCCASFDEKKENRCCNSTEIPNHSLNVSCEAVKCMYNREHLCEAGKIGISGSGAKKRNQTECATFRMK